jgi:tight adherence protein B
MANDKLLIDGLAFLAIFSIAWLLVQCVWILMSLYQHQMTKKLDRDFRDLYLLLNPVQLLTFTMTGALIILPMSLFFFNWLVATVFTSISLVLPGMLVKLMKSRRKQLIIKQLPDSLSVLASTLRSGQNLVKSLEYVRDNQPAPISQEIAQVLFGYQLGVDVEDSISQWGERIKLEDLMLLSAAIRMARAQGGQLSNTLDSISQNMRDKSQAEGKINALSAMGKAQAYTATCFPLLIGVVFYFIEPEAIQMMFVTSLGWTFLTLIGVMILCAFVMINKIVKVRI